MESQPLVTVVIPTYKRVEYLGEAIASALAQTHRNLEVIVSDNAGLDEVRRLVASFGDSRLRYRSNEANLGAMGNAVAAYREARGKYIGTMHDDDTWLPHMVERLVTPLEADDDLVVAFSDYWHVDETGRRLPEISLANSRRFGLDDLAPGVHRPFLEAALVRESVPLVISALFRRDAVDWDRIRLEADPLTDRWLNYLLARTGRGAFFVPERLTQYRLHGASISSSTRSFEAVRFCYEQWLSDPALAPLHPQLQRHLGEAHRLLGMDLLRRGHMVEARAAFDESLRFGASRRASAGRLLASMPSQVAASASRAWSALPPRVARLTRRRARPRPRAATPRGAAQLISTR